MISGQNISTTWLPSLYLMVLFAAALFCASGGAVQGASRSPVKPFKVEAFDLSRVRLLDSPFRDAMLLDRKYVMSLDPDRLLHTFRLTAGLPTTAKSLGGWESPDHPSRGEFIGHYLSACALLYAATGDQAVKSRAELIVNGLAKCQDASSGKGYNPGYLGAFPESYYDAVEQGKPIALAWYHTHKQIAGLLDVYTYCGNKQALEVAEKMADWVKYRTGRLSEEKMQESLNLEFGGMGEAMANLYAITGNPDHIMVAARFDKKLFFDPLSKGIDNLQGLHSNTHIPQVIAAAREYEMTGNDYYQHISSFFWKEVADKRSFVTGGTSNGEAWRTPPDKLSTELSPSSQETCCTYNMLKLTKHIFEWTADPHCADFYERALYNSILSTQNPETGTTMYFVPLNPGGWKLFCTPYDSFWCCTGTGMENHAKYGEAIYFRDAKGLYVNLFIPSVLNWKDRGLVLRQETRFPEEDTTTFTLDLAKPGKMAVRIRVPYWAKGGISVTVNGKKWPLAATPCSYVSIERTWKGGDKVVVRLPMSLHLAPMPDEPKLTAIMYGPLVMAGEFGSEGLTKDLQIRPNQGFPDVLPPIIPPDIVNDSPRLEDWIKPVDGKTLTFRTSGAGHPNDVTLIPFYKLFGERYSIYWWKYTNAQYKDVLAGRAREEAERQAIELRKVDFVTLGNTESEVEHGVKAELSHTGVNRGLSWRDTESGWFSAELKVIQGQPQTLRCVYWGADSNRKFSISVDDTVICHESFNGDKGEKFFSVEYKLPENLLTGKEKVTVKFQADKGSMAGGMSEAAVLREKP